MIDLQFKSQVLHNFHTYADLSNFFIQAISLVTGNRGKVPSAYLKVSICMYLYISCCYIKVLTNMITVCIQFLRCVNFGDQYFCNLIFEDPLFIRIFTNFVCVFAK